MKRYAVVAEEGFLDEALAIFRDEGEAEQYRTLKQAELETGLVVVPVTLTDLELIEETDNGE